MVGSQTTPLGSGGGFGHVWRVCHAAVFCVFGGALGCWAGAIVSMMISCPPQHGHGSARVRGEFSVTATGQVTRLLLLNCLKLTFRIGCPAIEALTNSG